MVSERKTEIHKVKVYKLRDEATREQYTSLLEEKFSNQSMVSSEIETVWNDFKINLMRVAKECCGVVSCRSDSKHTNWWSKTVKDAVKLKKISTIFICLDGSVPKSLLLFIQIV